MKKFIIVLVCLFVVCAGAFAAMPAGGAFCLNFFLPNICGIGSLAQGDFISGGIIMVGSLGGTGLVIGGIANIAQSLGISVSSLFESISNFSSGGTDITTILQKVGGGLIMIGVGNTLIFASWIAGMARPWAFQKEQAAKGLTLYENPLTGHCTTLSLSPVIDTINKNYGFSTVIRY